MAAGSLRPNIVRVMAEHRERTLSTQEVYELVAETGVPGFDPRAKRDRNLVSRELSDLAGMSPESHSKPAPQLLARPGTVRTIEQPTGNSVISDGLGSENIQVMIVARSL